MYNRTLGNGNWLMFCLGSYIWRHPFIDVFQASTNINSGDIPTGTSNLGFNCGTRINSTSLSYIADGVTIDTSSETSYLASSDFHMFKNGSTYSSAQFSFAFIGGNIDSVKVEFYDAIQAYMTSIGKQV
jgi:hypothetical protein